MPHPMDSDKPIRKKVLNFLNGNCGLKIAGIVAGFIP
jgi:hypothetical protein